MGVCAGFRALIIAFSLLCIAQRCRAMHGVVPTRGQPWPKPSFIITGVDVNVVEEAKFQFSIGGKQCDILEHAFRRYHLLVFDDHDGAVQRGNKKIPANAEYLNRLVVTVEQPCTEPILPGPDMDESYKLNLAGTRSYLNSSTVWGALRGLETFSQLVYQADEGYLVVNRSRIEDKPRFSHRGVLLDTSRHFLPVDILLKALDGMSYNKFNVFHWHIVDDNSFPYQSYSFPELSQKGAFDPYTHVYTQEDIFRVIEYARVLGIRVVPEFDTPGHTQSWGKSHPEFLTKCYRGGAFTGTYGPVDPTKNATYSMMEKLLEEVVTVFKDPYIHLGGDEVSFECWRSNPEVAAFMKKMGFGSDYSKLEQYYMQNILNKVHALPRNTKAIIWQEVIDNNVSVPEDTVAHVWKGGYKDELAKMTKLGLRTLLSSCWYLDHISFGHDWQTYYACDPQDFNGTPAQKNLVFGGEAALWGELVDSTNVLPRLWPRASAVAERLWSASSQRDINNAASRLEEHRCRMIARGIPAQPVNGPGFCRKEFGGDRSRGDRSRSSVSDSYRSLRFKSLNKLRTRPGRYDHL